MAKFVVVYLYDILVYSRNEGEHADHIRRTLMRLRQHKFFAKRRKCQFAQAEVEFLGHVLASKGLELNQHKVSVVRDWHTPESAKYIAANPGNHRLLSKDCSSMCREGAAIAEIASLSVGGQSSRPHSDCYDWLS
jgi:hypothetical protein